jgi:hypothetical protein
MGVTFQSALAHPMIEVPKAKSLVGTSRYCKMRAMSKRNAANSILVSFKDFVADASFNIPDP